MKNTKIRLVKGINDNILKGLKEALAFSKDRHTDYVRTKLVTLSKTPIYKGKEIRRIRHKVSLTQTLFAESLGVSKKTVEAWESNKNIPQGPAQRMLYILDKRPEIIESL